MDFGIRFNGWYTSRQGYSAWPRYKRVLCVYHQHLRRVWRAFARWCAARGHLARPARSRSWRLTLSSSITAGEPSRRFAARSALSTRLTLARVCRGRRRRSAFRRRGGWFARFPGRRAYNTRCHDAHKSYDAHDAHDARGGATRRRSPGPRARRAPRRHRGRFRSRSSWRAWASCSG